MPLVVCNVKDEAVMDGSVNSGGADTVKQSWIAGIVGLMAYGKFLSVLGLLGSEGRVGLGFVSYIWLFSQKTSGGGEGVSQIIVCYNELNYFCRILLL